MVQFFDYKLKYLVFIILISVKLSSQTLNLNWAKKLGSTGNEYPTATAVDGSGNIYTIGYFEGTSDFDPGVGVYNLICTGMGGYPDIFISKLDANGNFLWAKSIGSYSLNCCSDVSKAITFDQSNNIIITGEFQGTADFDPGASIFNISSKGQQDIFILKLDQNGNFMWAKSFGGINNESSYSIKTDISNNIIVCGYFSGVVDFDPGVGTYNLSFTGPYGSFVSKLDQNGNFVWAKQFDGGSGNYARDISIDNIGNCIVLGAFSGTVDFDPNLNINNITSGGLADVYISKLDNNGNLIWVKSIDCTNGLAGCTAMEVNSLGELYVTGTFSNTIDFDPNTSIFNLTALGGVDIYILKINSSGNFIWAKAMGGTADDMVENLALDSQNNVYTVGFFEGVADFDPNVGVFNMTPNVHDLFISKLNSNGNFVWAKQVNSSWGTCINITNDVLIVNGIFIGTTDFDPGIGIYNMTSGGLQDIFILKLCEMTAPTVSISGSTPFCQGAYPLGDNLILTASSSSFYLWNTGAITQSISINTSGNYAVTVTNSVGCSASSNTVSVTFSVMPKFTYTVNGMVVNFQINSSNCGAFLWDFGNGNTSSLNPAPIVTYANSGTYGVCLQCNGNTQCVQCLNIVVPGNSIGGIGINEYYKNNHFKLLPNPTSGKLICDIYIENYSKLSLKVTDAIGKDIVLITDVVAGKTELDLSTLSKGMYFVQILNNSIVLETAKVIIE